MYATEEKFAFYFVGSLFVLCFAFIFLGVYQTKLDNNIKETQINYIKTVCPVGYNVVIETTREKVTSSCSK